MRECEAHQDQCGDREQKAERRPNKAEPHADRGPELQYGCRHDTDRSRGKDRTGTAPKRALSARKMQILAWRGPSASSDREIRDDTVKGAQLGIVGFGNVDTNPLV